MAKKKKTTTAKSKTKAKSKPITTSKKKSNKKKSSPKTEVNELRLSDEILESWAKKAKREFPELKEQYDQMLKNKQKEHPSWGEEKIYPAVRRRLYNEIKGEMRSSAVSFLFRVDYASTPYDYANPKYQECLDKYSKDPRRAKANKWVRTTNNKRGQVDKIIPTDHNEFRLGQDKQPLTNSKTGEKIKNKNWGKDLQEHAFVMSIGGLGLPYNKFKRDDFANFIRPSKASLFRKLADPDSKLYLGDKFEIGKWYLIKVTNNTDKDDEESYVLNATTLTKFNSVFEEIEMDIEQLKAYYEDFFAPLNELVDYHESYAKAKNANMTASDRLIVTEGDVVNITLSEDGEKSHMIKIDDESIGMGENDDEDAPDSIMCWVDPSIEIDFGKFSRVVIFGRTSRKKLKDEDNEFTDEWGTPTIAVQGIQVAERVEPEFDNETGGDENDSADTDGEVEVDEEEGEEPEIDNDEEETESEEEEEEETESEEEEEEEEKSDDDDDWT